MQVLASNSRPEQGCVVTIGAFDGVHRGHQALIEKVKARAAELGCQTAVVTFDRHPAAVVRPESAPKLLTDLDQKLELLAATGIDYTIVVPFDAARADETAEHFVKDVLLGRLNARSVIIGYDFHFGKGRLGNVELLRTMGAELGFEVEELGPVGEEGTVISSTEVRRLVAAGNVRDAAGLLGRPYEVRGLVVMGDGRGRQLGYPTANLHVTAEVLLPGDGVYAGEYVFPDGSTKPTAISLGTRPTFYEDGINLLEAYVLDFSGDLYGQYARVRFIDHIRDQEKFDGMDSLMVQLAKDVEHTRELAQP